MSDDPTPTIHDPFPAAPTTEPVRPLMPAAKPKKSSSGMWLNLLLVVAAAVAIGGVAFALGRSTAPVAAAAGAGRTGFGNGQLGAGRSFDPNASFAPGQGGGLGFGRGGGNVGITGTVDSVTADSITVKTANGQTVTFTLSGATTYHQATTATAGDVTTGATVTVRVGGFGGGAAGQPGASGAPALTATDVTVGK